jgi:hypothetical protein
MSPPPQVEIVVPIRDEERDLAPSIRRLTAYLREHFPVLSGLPWWMFASSATLWGLGNTIRGVLWAVTQRRNTRG